MADRPWYSTSRIVISGLISSLTASFAAQASANDHEVVFANNRTQLHIRAGEAAPIVGHAEQGDELEVLGDEGRWLKVRDGKQVGWLTRTEVAHTKPAEPRARAQRSGFSGKPVSDSLQVTVAIDSVRAFDDPQVRTRSALTLQRGDVVTTVGRGHDGWILVEKDGGKLGWIPASAVIDAGKLINRREAPQVASKQSLAASTTAPALTPEITTATAAPVAIVRAPDSESPALSIGVLATAGGQSFKMQQTGQGDGTAIASGPLATILTQGQLRIAGSLWGAVGGTAELGTANMTYSNATGTSVSMSTRELAIDGYGTLGWGGQSYLAVRGGVHYATLQVNSDRNEPMLIGERIGGPTAGLGGGVPIYRSLELTASVDVMPVGAQKLSRLPAGTLYASKVRELWGHASLSLPLPAHLVTAVCYRFGLLQADLTDGAVTPKTAGRTDQSHVITAGIGMMW